MQQETSDRQQMRLGTHYAMSRAPSSSYTGGAQENTPPHKRRSLQQFQGLRTSLFSADTPSKLLPRDVMQERILQSQNQTQKVTTTEIVLACPRPKTPSQVGSEDFGDGSVYTVNSPKEREPRSPSTHVQSAPLPAPLHVIHAALSTAVVLRPRSFSTASVALSGHPAPSDEDSTWGAPPASDCRTSEEAAMGGVNPSLALVTSWEALHNFEYPVVDLTQNRRDDCDINPANGKPIPPVRYIKLQENKHSAHQRNLMDRNSEGHIDREIALRKAMKEEIERKEQDEKEAYTKMTLEEDKWPDAHCTLRPAEAGDLQSIANIINLEMRREDSQISPSKVEPAHIATLYNNCLAKHRPFIVAISSPTQIPNRYGWSKDEEEAYQEFLKFKKSRQASQGPGILGFAFVNDSRQGFLGGVCSGSRFSGQIKLVVHPNHRRKLVGSALLDRILLCTSIYHRSLVDYTWDCSETKRTYEYVSTHNQQKYNRLYLETFFTGSKDPRIEGIIRLLEKYDFARVAHFKEAVKHGKCPGVWKDLVVWEHEARSATEIVED
ncbi:hypothetical protein F53441_7852 [Fusarium austroafricanum]|uniref:Uncharacterized protein n=1 Tax=Fusarium austroafricanum TaxID=2364996 RepID=A0A8H4NX57_9HYPO|nr:hypothetical protein F53441_7852 [Fusarium austroafricanum]